MNSTFSRRLSRRRCRAAHSWAIAPDESLYGGNAADRQTFCPDPATGALQNVGKSFGMHLCKDFSRGPGPTSEKTP